MSNGCVARDGDLVWLAQMDDRETEEVENGFFSINGGCTIVNYRAFAFTSS